MNIFYVTADILAGLKRIACGNAPLSRDFKQYSRFVDIVTIPNSLI